MRCHPLDTQSPDEFLNSLFKIIAISPIPTQSFFTCDLHDEDFNSHGESLHVLRLKSN